MARLYAQAIARGFKPSALQDTNYGMREFSLRDPDRHLLSSGEHIGKKLRSLCRTIMACFL